MSYTALRNDNTPQPEIRMMRIQTDDEMLQSLLNDQDPFTWVESPVLETPGKMFPSSESSLSSRTSMIGLDAASAPVKGASMDDGIPALPKWSPELMQAFKDIAPSQTFVAATPAGRQGATIPSSYGSSYDKDSASMVSAMTDTSAPIWMPPVQERPGQVPSSSESSLSSRASMVGLVAASVPVKGLSTNMLPPFDQCLTASNPPAAAVSARWQESMTPSETSSLNSPEDAVSMITSTDSTGMEGYWTTSSTHSSASSCVGLDEVDKQPFVNPVLREPKIMSWPGEIGLNSFASFDGRTSGIYSHAKPQPMNAQFDPSLAAMLAYMDPMALEKLKLHCLSAISIHSSPPALTSRVPSPTHIARAQRMTVAGSGRNGWTGQRVNQRISGSSQPALTQAQKNDQVYGWSPPPGADSDIQAFAKMPTALSIGRKIPAPQKFGTRRSSASGGSVDRTSKDLRRKVLKQSASPYRIPDKVQAISQAPQYKIAPKMGERV